MSENTAIEWCDSTWSPWEGCTNVSPGCDHCYAEGMNKWLRKGENWGPGAPRRIYSEDHWGKPVKWQREATKFDTLHGRHRRVFPSVCDPFDNEALPFLRDRLFGLIRMTPHLDWLLLTKRIGNAKAMLPADWGDGYPNVWIGATVVNQEEADRDIPKLLAIPARVRFLSIEPMLGPIELDRWLTIHKHWKSADSLPAVPWHPPYPKHWYERQALVHVDWKQGLHWVIAGGESGQGARPAHPDWFRSLRDQCAAAGVPYLFKQWGEWAPTEKWDWRSPPMCAIRRDGSQIGEDETLGEDGHRLIRLGKKAAGRLLDGITHDGFPEALGASRHSPEDAPHG